MTSVELFKLYGRVNIHAMNGSGFFNEWTVWEAPLQLQKIMKTRAAFKINSNDQKMTATTVLLYVIGSIFSPCM